MPYATPISFPSIDKLAIADPNPWTRSSAPDLFSSFVRIRRPPDVTSEHLQALNIQYLNSPGFDALLGESENASRYLPPISWLEPPPEDGTNEQEDVSKRPLLHNGRPAPTQHDFYTRIKELYHSNDDAFRTLNQVPSRDRHAHPPIRLAHFRRFWEGLDNMALYWDSSHDEYLSPAPQEEKVSNDDASTPKPEDQHRLPLRESHALSPDPPLDEARKRSKQDHPNDKASPDADHHYQDASGSHAHHHHHHHAPAGSHTVVSSLGLHSLVHSGHPTAPNTTDTNSPPEGTLYRGTRISTGSSMPEQHRIDTVRAFVEPLAWSWGFTVGGHRRGPVAAVRSLRVPVRVTAAVWRVPRERDRAKHGWLEGPVLAISCRNDTGFADARHATVRDLLREVGVLVVLAQERAREGRKEVKAGEGKWWASVPRWGGGAGGEVGEGRGVGDEPVGQDGQQSAEDQQDGPKPKPSQKRRFNAMEAWKIVRFGAGTWDPRVQYEAIGKKKGDEFDDVSRLRICKYNPANISIGLPYIFAEPPHQRTQTPRAPAILGVLGGRRSAR